MIRKVRKAGVSPEPGTKRWYLPLINRKLSKALTITISIYSLCAAVQIAVSIIFNNPNRFEYVVPILGDIMKMYA